MLFNSGTPSLIDFTRYLLADPSTAAKPMFTDAIYKVFLNVEYLALREVARFVGQGSGLKIAYDDAVDGTIGYSMPADFIRMRSVLLDTAGNDLSGAPSATTATVLEPVDFALGHRAWQTDELTSPKYYAIQDRVVAILAPPGAAAVGTNSIQFVYEASTAELSGDTDEPTIGRPHHQLICLRAAITMLATKNQENQVLMIREAQAYERFKASASEEAWDPNHMAYVAGLDDQTDWPQNTGFVK